MIPQLTVLEQRIIGCLLEKAATTPDQYPLTLNALVAACNQKSSRNPIMTLSSGEVQGAARRLSDRHLLVLEENFRSRVEKYQHRFCNTPFGDLKLDPPSYAVVTLLLLRGPQTPGELRTRTSRLHAFADNAAVQATLDALQAIPEALVAQLPKAAGRRDHEWMHRFGGAVEGTLENAPTGSPRQSEPVQPSTAALEAKITQLEDELAVLKAKLKGE